MPARGELCIHYKLDRNGEPRLVPLKHSLKTITVKEGDTAKCDHLMFYDMDGGTVAIIFEESRIFIAGIGFPDDEKFRASVLIGLNQPATGDDEQQE